MANASPNAGEPNANYISLACFGAHVGSARFCVGFTRLHVCFLDTNMLVLTYIRGLEQVLIPGFQEIVAQEGAWLGNTSPREVFK